jgi:hypothetical protein
MRKALALLCLLPFLTGCTYTANRLNDLIDVARVDLLSGHVGPLVNVGPFMLGSETAQGGRLSLGLGGFQVASESGQAAGFLVAQSRFNEWGRRYFLASAYSAGYSAYGHAAPPWGSVGADVGLGGIGVGAHADVVELLDFVFGIIGWDIAGDDG